jgi:hypothetical protein
MAILTKGQTFANADSVTSTKLNNLVDAAAFVAGASGTTDNTSLEVNGSGRLQIKDLGVTSAKIAASAVTTTKLPDSTLATDGVTYAKLQRVANMKALGNVSGSLGVASEISILDEDDMVSNSATSLTTQQSIKAYVDSKPVLTIATAQASTSGTSIDFTSIPSSVKRITVMFSSVSTSGTSNLLIQIGDSGGIESTSYTSQCQYITISGATSSAGFVVTASNPAADTLRGLITLCLINPSTNSWVASSSLSGSTTGNIILGSGGKSLSSTLDRVRVTTVNGTDTFDAGSINIMYE